MNFDTKALVYLLLILGYIAFELFARQRKKQEGEEHSEDKPSTEDDYSSSSVPTEEELAAEAERAEAPNPEWYRQSSESQRLETSTPDTESESTGTRLEMSDTPEADWYEEETPPEEAAPLAEASEEWYEGEREAEKLGKAPQEQYDLAEEHEGLDLEAPAKRLFSETIEETAQEASDTVREFESLYQPIESRQSGSDLLTIKVEKVRGVGERSAHPKSRKRGTLKEFDLRKAILYSEIMRPKYF
jgi:hypothetical protein